jgi:hypothetical protein
LSSLDGNSYYYAGGGGGGVQGAYTAGDGGIGGGGGGGSTNNPDSASFGVGAYAFGLVVFGFAGSRLALIFDRFNEYFSREL